MTAQGANVIQLQTQPVAGGPWVSLLNVAHELKITRPVFDLGTLEATFLDPALDPALEGVDSLTPGRPIYVAAQAGGKWETIWSGTILDVETVYTRVKAAGTKVRPRINVRAVDAFARMAQLEPVSVLRISELPYLFAGSGIAYNCNDISGSIAQPPTITLGGGDRTLADQVALTRDTNLGYAWVNRNGQLAVRDGDRMPAWRVAIQNPNFISSAQYWLGYNGATIIRDTTSFRSAPAGGRLMASASGGTAGAYCTDGGTEVQLGAGQTVTIGAWWSTTVARTVRINFLFQSASGASTGNSVATVPVPGTGAWTQVEGTFTAPAGTAKMAIRFDVSGTAPNEVHRIDDAYGSISGLTTFTDAAGPGIGYSAFEAGYDTEAITNRIWVKVLTPGPAGSEPVETVNGPYDEPASVTDYGAHLATYSTHADPNRSPSAYAAAIKARNAYPKPRCHTLRMPVRNTTEREAAALLDLYDLVLITLTGTLSARGQLITGIVHTITPDAWTVDYTFDTPGTVAPPSSGPTLGGR